MQTSVYAVGEQAVMQLLHVNLLPIFSNEQRMMYAEISIVATFPLNFYDHEG
jgi:hypothetical protein